MAVATTGVDLDPDGYIVSMDGKPGQPVPVDGVATFPGLSTGIHTVALAGIAGNCQLSGPNPRQVDLTTADTTLLSLAVACVTATGSIQITTATAGADIDPDGYRARVDGGAPLAIGVSGVITFAGLTVGAHSVTLAGITDNCAVNGDDPHTVLVAGLDTTRLTFSLACTSISSHAPDSAVVSNPVLLTASAFQSDRSALRLSFLSSSDSVVYVSMPPGTIAVQDDVVVRNRTSGAQVTVSTLNGGFDPVPLSADVGDSVQVVAGSLQFMTVVRPIRPPVVVRSEPPAKKTDVPINCSIVVVFSEPMNGGTISTGTVRLLQDSEPVAGTAVLDPDGLRVEFRPAAALAPNSPYVLTLTTGVRDATAERLEQPVEVEFTTGATAASPSSLTFSPTYSTIAVGDQLQLNATPRDAAGNALGGTITWSTSNPSVTISPTGLMTGMGVGGDTIGASSGGLTAGGFVQVVDSTSINLRGSWDWTATLADATRGVSCAHSGSFVFTQLAVNFGGLADQVASCTGPMNDGLSAGANGRVRGDSITIAVGTCTFLARVRETRPALLQGTVSCPDAQLVGKWTGTWQAHPPWPLGTMSLPALPLIAVGEGIQLTAELQDTSGHRVFDRTLSWSSSSDAIATVSPSGLVTGVNLGPATITAAGEGKSAGAGVTVTSPAAVRVATATSGVDPDPDGYLVVVPDRGPAPIGPNDSLVLSQMPVGSNTVELLGVAPNCGVSGGPIASVTTARGDTGRVAFTVTCAPLVASVTVSPASNTLAEGDTLRLVATPRDSVGNPLPGRQAVWAVTDRTVALVGSSGLVSALQQGTTTITAAVEGQSGTAAITVTAGQTFDLGGEWVFSQSPDLGFCRDSGSFVLSSPTPSTLAGTTTQVRNCPWTLAATITDGQVVGRNLSFGDAPCDYTGSVLGNPPNELVGTYSCYNGYGNYTGVWEATLAGPPASVLVTPAAPHLLLRASQQLAAVVQDAAGRHLFASAVNWSAGDAAIASVSPAGLVTGTGPGTATITATAGAASGSATITVETLQLTAVVPGGGHTCGLTPTGAAYCWGFNDHGELGTGSPSNGPTPAPVPVSGGLVFSSVSTGWTHSCALTPGGTAYCWGRNEWGNLGDATLVSRATPVPVAGGLVFGALSIGGLGTCGITADGTAYCWGDYTASTPVAVPGGFTFTTLSKGWGHTCGLTSGGVAYCWGDNGYGQLGNGSTLPSATPSLVSGGLRFTSISAGDYHTCGVTTGGAAYCWGSNDRGELGNGTMNRSNVPVPVFGGYLFRSVSAASLFTCGLATSGAAFCWGGPSLSPAIVLGGLTFDALKAAASSSGCGMTQNGVAYCWGENNNGQLGDGTTNSTVNYPVKVAGQP